MSEQIIFSDPCPECEKWLDVTSRTEPTKCECCGKSFKLVDFWDASEGTLIEMLEEVEDV